MHEESEIGDEQDLRDDQAEAFLRKERARLGMVAVMVASQEVTSGAALDDDEAFAA